MTQDKLAHLFAGGFIAAALLPFGTVPAALAVVAAGVGREWMRWPLKRMGAVRFYVTYAWQDAGAPLEVEAREG